MATFSIDGNTPLTPELLYRYSLEHGLQNARLRICDGMAVSFFPRLDDVGIAKSKLIIDVSDCQPVEYDELAADDKCIIYRVQGVECPTREADF